jgi:DNA invertase Pin-like site-specific DNA recombinase
VDAGTSGSLSIEDRPVLLDAVATLKRGDCLLVAKRERLGRDVIAVALIERLVSKRGARVVSAAGEGTDTEDDPSSVLITDSNNTAGLIVAVDSDRIRVTFNTIVCP